MNTTTKTLAAMSALALAVGSTHAAPITVVNHSFEDGSDGSGGSIQQAPWTDLGGNTSIPIQELAPLGAAADPSPDGTDTTHYTNNNTTDNIYQVLVATLAANTKYTLKVDVGDRTNTVAQSGAIRLGYVSATPAANDDFGLNLLAANVINDTVPVNTAGSSTDGWQTWESTFTTGATPTGLGQQLRIELVSFGAVQTLWDNVRLDAAPVPEPGSLALMGLGGLLIARRRRNA